MRKWNNNKFNQRRESEKEERENFAQNKLFIYKQALDEPQEESNESVT